MNNKLNDYLVQFKYKNEQAALQSLNRLTGLNFSSMPRSIINKQSSMQYKSTYTALQLQLA